MESEKVKEIKEKLQEEVELGKEYCLTHRRVGVDDLCDILTLINELESENAYKQEHIELWFKKNEEKKKRIAELEKENGELKQHITEVEKGIINIAKERNKKDELASKFIDSYNDSLKQFAEKLKEELKGIVGANFIDETLKEFINESM